MEDDISISLTDIARASLTQRILRSRLLNESIAKLRSHSSLSEERSGLAARCFDLSIEHHAATLDLIESRKYGSANALLRTSIESTIAGFWIVYCAPKDKLPKIYHGQWKWKLDSMIATLASTDETKVAGKQLKSILSGKTDINKTLDDFIHGGELQLKRRFPGHLESKGFTFKEIRATLLIADMSVAAAAAGISVIESSTTLKEIWEITLVEIARENHIFFGGPEPPDTPPPALPQPNPKS